MPRPEPAFRPFVMDRPVLHAFVRELLALERLQAFAAALPARARVSEPVLPLLLATLHEQLERGLVCLLPEDADARDAAEAAGWFIGAERVALLPSRGVRWGSGLEPPPHLVGERARALDVLAGGRARLRLGDGARRGNAAALSRRAAPVRLEVGAEPGLDGLAEALALAGYERVERAEERGQFAVRGGLVDVFPTTGREPLRIELFGDEIEQVRAFSPFTQRALHPVDDAVVYPAAERRADLDEPTLADDEGPGELRRRSRTTSCRCSTARRTSSGSPTRCARVWAEEGLDEISLEGHVRARPVPAGAAVLVRGPAARDRRARARGGRERARRLRPRRQPRRRRVPARGEALRTENLLRRADARVARRRRGPPRAAGAPLRRRAGAPRLRLARARARRCCPTRRSSASVRRAPTAGSAARSRRSPTCAPATSSSTRTTASASCSASRRRRSPASRATTSSSRSAARTASTSRTSSSARSRSTSAPTRARPRSRSSAARRGRT